MTDFLNVKLHHSQITNQIVLVESDFMRHTSEFKIPSTLPKNTVTPLFNVHCKKEINNLLSNPVNSLEYRLAFTKLNKALKDFLLTVLPKKYPEYYI